MKPVFLSLGSNYSFSFASLALQQLIRPDSLSLSQLANQLALRFGTQPVFYYKGRDAIEQLLRSVQRKHRQPLTVFTQALSCYAIEEAVKRMGGQTVYVDLGPKQLNLTAKTLDDAFQRVNRPTHGVVIVQHSLGFPADIKSIQTWAHQRSFFLIEDLAQSFGAMVSDGIEVGMNADGIVSSFGKDKIIDAVSGGMAGIRQNAKAAQLSQPKPDVSNGIIVKDLTYPLLTWAIRKTHRFGLGKVFFRLGKLGGWLSSPILSPTQQSTGLPLEYGSLALQSYQQLEQQLSHRRRVAHLYFARLEPWMWSLGVTESVLAKAACLRYPLLVPDVSDFVAHLRKHNVFASDRWYRAPVDTGTFVLPSVYASGQCPRAEFISKHLCNLPTHQAVSMQQAEQLSALVHTYLQQPAVALWYSKLK